MLQWKMHLNHDWSFLYEYDNFISLFSILIILFILFIKNADGT